MAGGVRDLVTQLAASYREGNQPRSAVGFVRGVTQSGLRDTRAGGGRRVSTPEYRPVVYYAKFVRQQTSRRASGWGSFRSVQ